MDADQPDRLSYLMSFLKLQEYPLIHSMSTEEIIDVFNKNNRPYLVSWALTLLSKDCYESVLGGQEQNETLLANLVCSHGFCDEKQKGGFLDGNLALEEQLDILYKIFTFIDNQKQAGGTNKEPNNFKPATLEDLSSLMNTDVNIFPTFGPMKTLTNTEREDNLKEIQSKIEETSSKQEKLIENSHLGNVDMDHINIIVANMQNNLSQLERVVNNVVRETSGKVEANYKIEPRFAKLLEECNGSLKIIAQYTEDLKTLSNSNIEEIQLHTNALLPSIEALAAQMMALFGKTETLKYFYY